MDGTAVVAVGRSSGLLQGRHASQVDEDEAGEKGQAHPNHVDALGRRSKERRQRGQDWDMHGQNDGGGTDNTLNDIVKGGNCSGAAVDDGANSHELLWIAGAPPQLADDPLEEGGQFPQNLQVKKLC